MPAARRFFVEGKQSVGASVAIGGTDARKIVAVLRLKEGDDLVVTDSAARSFTAAIERTGRVVRVKLLREVSTAAPAAALRVDAAQAVPKGNRMDFVVEKGTELGVGAFLPFYCERSVGRSAGPERLARWRRLARAAAQQCGRRDVPPVGTPLGFEELLAAFPAYDAVLFAFELAAPQPLSQRLRELLPERGRVLVVVGPEGGFTHAEAERAAAAGAATVWLGPRILRTDTAALVLLAVIGAAAS